MRLLSRIIALHELGKAEKPIELDDATANAFLVEGLAEPHVHLSPKPPTYTITALGREVLAAANRVSARDLRLLAVLA